MRLLHWFYPGLGVKRWLLVLAVGILLVAVGAQDVLEPSPIGNTARILWGVLRNSGLPSAVLALFLISIGCCMVVLALRQLTNSVLRVVAPESYRRLGQVMFVKRYLEKGPRIVAIGGGTGLPVLLRGLKDYTSNITAVVTVTDDGGSSGRLRAEMGVLPPGDIRNCIVALADTEPLMQRLFQYRFTHGAMKDHSFGNLFIAAMTEVSGDFEEAIREVSKVLAIRGRVYPATLESVELVAEMDDGRVVRGESSIPRMGGRISRIYLEPRGCRALPEVLEAIAEADAVVLGPGSLYTSIIPPLLAGGITEAIISSRAKKIYVCNLMTQPSETGGYTALDHVRAIVSHTKQGIVKHVVVNTGNIPECALSRYADEGAVPVKLEPKNMESAGFKVFGANMVSFDGVLRHDHAKLAKTIISIIGGRRA